MSHSLKISPWKLKKDESAQLHWFSSPHRNLNGQWEMALYFMRPDGSIVSQSVPWGLLPYMKLGAIYENGKLTDRLEGHYDRLVLKPSQQIQMIQASEIPRSIFQTYILPDYLQEWVCSFRMDQISYYIPCLELVRAFMAPTRTLADALVSAGGLEGLYDGMNLERGNMLIDLSPEYPVRIASPEYILHLAWLLQNSPMQREWNKVRNRLLTRTELHAERTIQMIPPVSHPTTVQYRFIQKGDLRFVLGIVGLEDLVTPMVHTICYSHPKLWGREKTLQQRYQKIGLPGGEEDPNADQDLSEGPAKPPEHTVCVSVPSIFYKYKNRPDTRSLRSKKTKVSAGEVIPVGSPSQTTTEPNGKKAVSASNWSLGGSVDPVEFNVLDKAPDDDVLGLEEFIRFVHRFKAENPKLSIQLSVYYLPTGKPFSLTSSGTPRTCAIVRIAGLGQHPAFIIEISRPDRWMISTLVLVQKSDTSIAPNTLLDCLNSMLNNYGHWKEAALVDNGAEVSIHLVKHQKRGGARVAFQRIVDLII